MNTNSVRQGIRGLTGLISIACGSVLAGPVSLPFATNFDGYAVGTTVNSLGDKGWWASADTVVITNESWNSSPNSVVLPQRSQVTNAVIPSAFSNLWTQVHVKEADHMGTDRPDVDTNVAVMVGLDQSGCPILYDTVSGQWVVCTNDAFGNDITGLYSIGYVAISIHQNFSNHQAAIFMNDRCIRDQWPFINAGLSGYSGLLLNSGSTNELFLDDVFIGTNCPPGLTHDRDVDGLPDAAEIETYGNLDRWQGTRQVTNGIQTIQAALDLALPGETVVIGTGSYAEDLVAAVSVALRGTNVTVVGGLTVTGSVVVTLDRPSDVAVSGVTTIESGSKLVIVDGTVTIESLDILAGGMLCVTNGTVVINGASRTGTFTLEYLWDAGIVAGALPFADDFESYGEGTMLVALGARSWGASSTDPRIQTNQATVYGGGKAVEITANSLVSNAINSSDVASSNIVWTEMYVKPTTLMGVDRPDVDTNVTVMLFLDQSRALVVYDPAVEQWVVCTNDVWGNSIVDLYGGGWARITLCQNYTSHVSAVFLNDHLVREQLRFINTNRHAYEGFQLNSGATNATYLDEVLIRSIAPSDLLGNHDHDDVVDAFEIQSKGTALPVILPPGCVYLIR